MKTRRRASEADGKLIRDADADGPQWCSRAPEPGRPRLGAVGWNVRAGLFVLGVRTGEDPGGDLDGSRPERS